jgi:tRNA (adenine22-N1)-methyltransferase
VALSNRLEFLASFYKGEESIYDIGCDHGLLGLSFKTNPKVKNIYLIDPNPYSVDLIKKTIDSYITEPVLIYPLKISGEETKIVSPNSLVFIAGMGGKNIISILSSWREEDFANCSQIVLSPHRYILELREFLNENQFSLIKEAVFFENDQFYEMISITKKPTGISVSPYGEELWKGEEGANYLKHRLRHLSHHREARYVEYLKYLKGLKK